MHARSRNFRTTGVVLCIEGVAAELERDDELGSFVARIREEISAFADECVAGVPVEGLPTGYAQVFTPGSRVCHQQAGQMATGVEIVRPTMMEGKLMYPDKNRATPRTATRAEMASSILHRTICGCGRLEHRVVESRDRDI